MNGVPSSHVRSATMSRSVALAVLLALALAPGCYRVVRARGVYGSSAVVRPTPLSSGTYWTLEGDAVVSAEVSASSGVAAAAYPSNPPAAYGSPGVFDGGDAVGGASAEGALEVTVAATSSSTTTSTTSTTTTATASSTTTSSSTTSTATAVSGPVDGAWSAAGGWSHAADADLELRFGSDVDLGVPALGVELTGAGSRLSAIAGVGVRVACDGCSVEGEIAALSRLVPLGEGSLAIDARVGGDANVVIEAELAHEGLPAAGGASEVIVRVRGGEAPPSPPPLRIHLVIDASTSMETRWESVKNAALSLIGTLRPEDELEIVVYGSEARVALTPTRVGDGSAARRVVRGLRVGGRTNIEAGLRAAYADVAPDGGSIVLLLSDGVPQGGAASAEELGALAASAYTTSATTTVAIGLGVEFHAGILRTVAAEGHGDFRIAPRMTELPALLAAEIEAHGRVVARDVAIEVALGEGVVLGEGALPSGVTIVDGQARILVPAVSAGAELTFALPVVVGRAAGTAAEGRAVASVSAGWTSALSAHGHADKTLRVARTSACVPSGSMRASLDLDLRTVLELAAGALENGEAERAASLLETHALEVEGVLAVHADAALTERASASRALAWSLRTLVPEASWPERRSTAAEMLEWSVALGR